MHQPEWKGDVHCAVGCLGGSSGLGWVGGARDVNVASIYKELGPNESTPNQCTTFIEPLGAWSGCFGVPKNRRGRCWLNGRLSRGRVSSPTCPRESPMGAGAPHFRPCWGSRPLTEIARGPATPADFLHSVSTTETSPVGPGWVCKRSGACAGEPRFLNATLFKRALGTGALPSFGVCLSPHA